MSKEPIRVLIVDDCAKDRECIKDLLNEGVGTKYKEILIFEADTGRAGYQFCVDEQPHCILLDCHLPDEDSVQFLARLEYRVARQTFPAVIVLACQGSEAVAAEAMRHGAVDFVIKENVTAQGLQTIVRRAVADVKRRKRNIDASRKLVHARAQLHAAGEIQSMLLPQRPPRVPGLDIAGACFPADESGGDFYDFPEMADGSLGIVLGDVSGHGLGPAILAADTRAYLRAFASTHTSLGDIIIDANRLLCQDTRGERFVTLFLTSIDLQSRTMRFASAGHRAFYFDKQGSVKTIESQQPPLGLAPEYIRPLQGEHALEPGGLLLMITDGITETSSSKSAPRSKATMFGEPRALETVQEHRHCSAEDIIKHLVERVQQFTSNRSQDDDMTIVVVKVLD